MMKSIKKLFSTHNELVQCDLEFPRFQRELEELGLDQLDDFDRCVDKIEQMTWAQVLATASKHGKRGLNWEPITRQKTKTGSAIATIRVTRKFRARVTRDGVFMRFISLHLDHDSAYEESGGERI